MNQRHVVYLMLPVALFALQLGAIAQTSSDGSGVPVRKVARLFPDDTSALATVPDVPGLKSKIVSHQLSSVVEEKQIRAFFRPLLESDPAETADSSVKNVTGYTMDQLSDMLAGPLAIGLVRGESQMFDDTSPGDRVQVMMIGDLGGSAGTVANDVMPALLEHAKETARQNGDRELFEKTETIGGATVHTILERHDGETDETLSWLIHEEHIVVVTRRTGAILQKTLQRLKTPNRSAGSLASAERFSSAVRAQKGVDLFVFTNVGQMVDAAIKAAKSSDDGGQSDMSTEKVMNALGMDRFEWMSGGMTFNDASTDVDLRLTYNGRKGLTKLLAFNAMSRWTPDQLSLPADLVQASVTRFSFSRFWQTGQELFQSISPRMHKMLNAQLDRMESNYGISIQEDVLRSFGDRLVLAVFPSESTGEDASTPQSQRQLWAIRVNDQQRLTSALNTLEQSVGKGKTLFTTSDYLGTTIHTVNPSLIPASGSSSMEPSYAFYNGYLLYALTKGPVRNTIAHGERDGDPGFFEQQSVHSSLDRLPAEPASVGYTDASNMITSVINQLKTTENIENLDRQLGGLGIQELVNPDAEIDAEVIGKYIQNLVVGMYMNDRHLRMIWRLNHQQQGD